jgi:hypothetical protein
MYLLFLLVQGVTGHPLLQNITVPLPSGTSNHGVPGLLCTPTRWTDIVTFYLANYVAHTLTTRSLPGERPSSFAMAVMVALFFPAAGAFRGILGIWSLAIFRNSDLEKAARAGALCMLIRTSKWKAQNHNKLYNTILRLPSPDSSSKKHNTSENRLASQVAASSQEENDIGTDPSEPTQETTRLAMYNLSWGTPALLENGLSESEFRIHGSYKVPPGYAFCRVPQRATFIESETRPQVTQTARLSYNYNVGKILVSLGQAIYAICTLYRARGDQISQFGYAAFGLTVAPYAVVSVLNLLGSLCCPEFPALYMVESSIMEEARQRGDEYVFKGTVGKLAEDMITNTTPQDPKEIFRWNLEPIIVSVNATGEVQVSSETQDEFSHILTGSTEIPETTVEEGSSSDEKIATDTGNSSDNQIENKRWDKKPDKGKPSTQPAGIVTTYEVDAEESQPTTAQPSKVSDHPSEKLLLVPLANPLKWDKSSRQKDDYRIYKVVPGYIWTVCTNHENDLVPPTSANIFSTLRALSLSKIFPIHANVTSAYAASLLATMLPVVINGALSKFHPGHSTSAQGLWTMTWLGFGSLGSFFLRADMEDGGLFSYQIVRFCIWGPPAIAGFVVVGQMMRSYGTCIIVT